MKLIFVCGCYENGKDGVGDYVRQLAQALAHNGDEIAVLALYDPYASTILNTEANSESGAISVLRFPTTYNWKERISISKKWVADINPDWLSLQYVHFAFNPRGLPFFLENHLLTIGGSRKWEIMFHELWMGMPTEATLKHKIWGQVQRALIKRMVKQMQPTVIHTQCQLYITQLQKLGYSPKYLPIFSNIPVVEPSQQSFDTSINIRFVIFGTIHPFSKIEIFAQEFVGYLATKNCSATFTFVGRNGNHLEDFITICNRAGIETVVLGEQSPENISALLAISHYGLATAAPITIEKNGTVIAMWDHGLPVICIGHEWQVSGIPPAQVPDDLLIYKQDNLAMLLEKEYFKRPVKNSVNKIANTFTDDLKQSIT